MTRGEQAQTPQQRKANEKFTKREEAKRGKPEKSVKKQKFKSPISQGWLSMFFPCLTCIRC